MKKLRMFALLSMVTAGLAGCGGGETTCEDCWPSADSEACDVCSGRCDLVYDDCFLACPDNACTLDCWDQRKTCRAACRKSDECADVDACRRIYCE